MIQNIRKIKNAFLYQLIRIGFIKKPIYQEMPEKIYAFLIENCNRKGFYIECGAYDGKNYSNTILLEKLGWKGLLVEPSPKAFLACLENRSSTNNIFVNVALVNSENIKYVEGDFDGTPMSSVNSLRLNNDLKIRVPAKTLQSILNENQIRVIDFFSLDVEGYELQVLEGMDLKLNPPKFILVELYAHNKSDITKLLVEAGYSKPINFSSYAKGYRPNWDGTHDDWLFIHSS